MKIDTTYSQSLIQHIVPIALIAFLVGGCVTKAPPNSVPDSTQAQDAPKPTPPTPISLDNKIVRFGFRYSGRNIESRKPVKPNAVLIQENGTSDEQLFLLLPAGRDSQTIQNITSGLCWTISSTSVDTPFRLQTCSPLLRAQQFTFTINSDGSYQILSDLSSLCLDIKDASKRVGAEMIQWDCTGSKNQRVDISIVDANPELKRELPNELSSLTSVDVYLAPQHSGKWLGLYEGGRSVGTPLSQMTDVKKRQAFQFVNEGGGQYSIRHPATGLCLAIGRNSVNNFGSVQLEPCDQLSSHFTFFSKGQQVFQIKNIYSGRCLDIEAGLTTDSAKLVTWVCNGSANQTFKIQRAD